jgi:hypothetical protein
MIKHAFLVGSVVALVAWAQTRISPGQLRSAMPGEVDRTYLQAMSLDRWSFVEIGPGLRLEPWRQAFRLVADPPTPAPAPTIQMQSLTAGADGQYLCGVRAQLVTRNGLVQVAGLDYDISGGAIVPRFSWDASDVVACLFVQ